ncbi:hypothetical protein DENSPDRAFT_844590 [Dentipellis sp. KUC8613]|nr:hypothetical protein DENSPDRAFT_844590 [Dentipellis sp. KUC8613]
MSAATTTLTFERYPTPPPTLNTLPREQRTRLIRSARKLGAVLGTTPILLDPALAAVQATAAPSHHPYAHAHSHSVPTTPRLARPPRERRHGSIFTMPVAAPPSPTSTASSSPASSRTSLSSDNASSAISTPRTSIESLPNPPSFSSKARRSGSPPRPLILHLTAVPLSPSDPRLPTPHTAHAMEREPVTPRTPTAADRAEMRRRKMAKLARTLGEPVPPELVFGAEDCNARRASESEEELVQPEELLAFARSRAYGMQAANASTPVVALPRQSMSMRSDASAASRTPTPPLPTPRPPKIQTAEQLKAKAHRRRSRSLSALPTPTAETTARVGKVPLMKRRTPVFASGARAPRGERWIGAWNRRDIHQVQMELRQLKGR